MNKIRNIIDFLQDKSILLLGMGREGHSTFQFLQEYLPNVKIGIADKNIALDCSNFQKKNISFFLGEQYLEPINDFDIVIKSPGISLKHVNISPEKITSQTDLFLRAFSKQCIGITGTKGKSTTASFIFHILKQNSENVVFGGNIGLPIFDLINKIQPDTTIVLELSSHQLEYIHKAPHIAILLNLFEEHLDHYKSYLDYQKAKYNIALKQNHDDFFIYNIEDERILKLIADYPFLSKGIAFSMKENEKSFNYYKNKKFWLKKNNSILPITSITEKFPLKGKHNFANVNAAIAALSCLENIQIETIGKYFNDFQPLSHRMEFIGTIDGISFYNDSISTIPQACIAAVEALKNVDTLILGGMDRGIDYQILVDYFSNHKTVKHFIFIGKAGERMMKLFQEKNIETLYQANNYEDVVKVAKSITTIGKICLLSPAAASYDQFKNFEQRGEYFKQLVKK